MYCKYWNWKVILGIIKKPQIIYELIFRDRKKNYLQRWLLLVIQKFHKLTSKMK